MLDLPTELSFRRQVRAELPSLRRLMISGTDLRAATATALATLRCGELVELFLRRVDMRQVELKVLLDSRWARRLEVLTIKTHNSAAPFNKVIDKSPCAKTLRIRRVGNMG